MIGKKFLATTIASFGTLSVSMVYAQDTSVLCRERVKNCVEVVRDVRENLGWNFDEKACEKLEMVCEELKEICDNMLKQNTSEEVTEIKPKRCKIPHLLKASSEVKPKIQRCETPHWV